MAKASYVWPLIFVWVYVACSSPRSRERDFDPARCNQQGGYEAGYNDGREGYQMNSSFSQTCREDLREGVRKGYTEGFAKGKKQREDEQAAQRQYWLEQQKLEQQRADAEVEKARREQNPPVLTRPGVIIIAPGTKPPSTKFQCTVSAFMKTFTGFGTSEIEAKAKAEESCRQSYHRIHCDGPATCQQIPQ